MQFNVRTKHPDILWPCCTRCFLLALWAGDNATILLLTSYATTRPNPKPRTPFDTQTSSPTSTVSTETGSSIHIPCPNAQRRVVPLCPPAPTFALLTECPQRPKNGFRSSPSSCLWSHRSSPCLPGILLAATPPSNADLGSLLLRVEELNSPAGTPTGGVTQRPPRKKYRDVMEPSVISETSLNSNTSDNMGCEGLLGRARERDWS
jgi:hypothetical protein